MRFETKFNEMEIRLIVEELKLKEVGKVINNNRFIRS
jgi:hypothetical protein